MAEINVHSPRRLLVELLLLHIERNQLGRFGHLVRMPPGPRWVRYFGHVQLGEDLEADLGHSGEIIFLNWPGSAFVCSWMNWGR